MTRFITSYSREATTEGREKVVLAIVIQYATLTSQGHHSFNNHMVERDPFNQVRHISRFLANTFGDLGERVNENIFEILVHILLNFAQRIFQRTFANTKHFVEETGKEDGVASLIDQLSGDKDTHLFVGHGG